MAKRCSSKKRGLGMQFFSVGCATRTPRRDGMLEPAYRGTRAVERPVFRPRIRAIRSGDGIGLRRRKLCGSRPTHHDLCSGEGSIIGGSVLVVCGATILALDSPALAVRDSLNACIQTVTAEYWVPATRRWACPSRSLARAAQCVARVLTAGRPQAGCETVECCSVPICVLS